MRESERKKEKKKKTEGKFSKAPEIFFHMSMFFFLVLSAHVNERTKEKAI